MRQMVKVKTVTELKKVYNMWRSSSVYKNTVFTIIGEPGIGKTHFLNEAAAERKETLWYINGASATPTMLLGVHKGVLVKDMGKDISQESPYQLPHQWAESDVIFVDEPNRGNILVSNLLMNVFSEKKVSNFCLKNKTLVAAMNDEGFVEDYENDPAFMGRMFRVHFVPSVVEKANILAQICSPHLNSEFFKKLKHKDRFFKLAVYLLNYAGVENQASVSFREATNIIAPTLQFGAEFSNFLADDFREIVDNLTLCDELTWDAVSKKLALTAEMNVLLKDTKDFILG